jgi:flagellar biosynthesis anti-sigma factor FlgM
MKKNKKSFEEGKKMPALESNREARIQAIKEAIAAGTYRIDNGELADSLVSDILWEQWEIIKLRKP